jgi:hypothetical protein
LRGRQKGELEAVCPVSPIPGSHDGTEIAQEKEREHAGRDKYVQRDC